MRTTRRRFAAIPLAITLVFVAASCMAVEEGTDISTSYLSGSPWRQFIKLNSPSEFPTRFFNDARDSCGQDITANPTPSAWGTIGSATDTTSGSLHTVSYSSLDSTFVSCMAAEIQDDPNDSDPEEHKFVICDDVRPDSTEDDIERDCESPDDGSGSNNVQTAASAFFRAAMSTNAQVEHLMVLMRDRAVENANTGAGSGCEAVARQRCVNDTGIGAPACIVVWGTGDTTLISNNGGYRTQWVRTCPSF